MNTITPFNFDGRAVRVVDIHGLPWFVAADVCAVLGTGNPSAAVAKLDADEKGITSIDTLGGQQSAIVLNESGLYATILRCRDAMTPGSAAHRFRRWVTADVLPTLRKTGSYGSTPPALNDPAALRSLLLSYSERVIELEERAGALEGENAILAPKAVALDRIATAEGSMSITAAAKALQWRPRALHAWLLENAWIYRRPSATGVMGYQVRIDAGHLEHKMVTPDEKAPARTFWQVLVTPKGLTRLAHILADERRAA